MYKKYLTALLFSTTLFCQINLGQSQNFSFSGEDFISGEDGVVRIYVNVWGHVESPGTYLIFEGADLVNILSIAGGPKDGADLRKIRIASKNGDPIQIYNIKDDFSEGYTKLKPHDTIIVKESVGSSITSRSSLLAAFFQLINLLYTIENLK